ncbi:HEAT repeat domain-containing protein [Tessaracoccus flavus]|jgi:DNA-binding transcriptional MerR regulator|uniref:Uncharacterized protein n=1 Tax=Tessaracoccus flavus TaxID=1610493 RepID=A0A1Q2CC29_9ACTN|nr:HEAT repeat domain-containing protein [Tessaracoccus flavus]AQP43673.1 hypothetical protein RPIT_01650 [Tessaracoccus flavus]SDZ02411.1 DNA-binding transcriptional regulator, MerR family [Tessaracoccus flavus]
MEWLRIGEVAARTGLTPRTLRHYDELGLLVPSGRTDGDYRLYSRDDMDRLLAIQHLKSLGLGLAEIQQALDDPTFDAGPLLERHARVVEQRIAAEQALLRRLRQLQTAAQTGWDEVLETIALSERLRHPDGEVRFRAALTGHASAPVEDLVERLRSDPEPGVREAATWALAQQGPAALRAVSSLADGDAQARHALAHVLGKLRTIEALPQLSLLLTDDVPEVAAKAAFSLGQVGGDEAVQLLIGALEDGRVAVRDEATSALGRLPESLASLTAAASHPLPQVRAQVAEALGFLAHPEAVPVLIAALEDDDADVRFSALLALGSAEGPEARHALEALTASPDRRTSLVAARLLEARPLS